MMCIVKQTDSEEHDDNFCKGQNARTMTYTGRSIRAEGHLSDIYIDETGPSEGKIKPSMRRIPLNISRATNYVKLPLEAGFNAVFRDTYRRATGSYCDKIIFRNGRRLEISAEPLKSSGRASIRTAIIHIEMNERNYFLRFYDPVARFLHYW